MYEVIMEDTIISYLEYHGYTPYVQIPFSLGKIDFVGIKDNECIVIETKINNWKKGLKQTINYGYGAEKAYVATPLKTANYIVKNHSYLFKKYDIGLLGISKKVDIIIECNNRTPSQLFKNLILKKITKRHEKSKLRIEKFLEKCNND